MRRVLPLLGWSGPWLIGAACRWTTGSVLGDGYRFPEGQPQRQRRCRRIRAVQGLAMLIVLIVLAAAGRFARTSTSVTT